MKNAHFLEKVKEQGDKFGTMKFTIHFSESKYLLIKKHQRWLTANIDKLHYTLKLVFVIVGIEHIYIALWFTFRVGVFVNTVLCRTTTDTHTEKKSSQKYGRDNVVCSFVRISFSVSNQCKSFTFFEKVYLRVFFILVLFLSEPTLLLTVHRISNEEKKEYFFVLWSSKKTCLLSYLIFLKNFRWFDIFMQSKLNFDASPRYFMRRAAMNSKLMEMKESDGWHVCSSVV